MNAQNLESAAFGEIEFREFRNLSYLIRDIDFRDFVPDSIGTGRGKTNSRSQNCWCLRMIIISPTNRKYDYDKLPDITVKSS